MTTFESICILLDEVKKKNSSKTGIEKVRSYNIKLDKYWSEKETSMIDHCTKNIDCYSTIELCYAEPLMKLANKLGSDLVRFITKHLSDEDLISFNKETDAMTNAWVSRRSKYAGLYRKVEKLDNDPSDKSSNYTQAQGTLVGNQVDSTPPKE